jgi:hypothetical protein
MFGFAPEERDEPVHAPESPAALESSGCVTGGDPVTQVVRQRSGVFRSVSVWKEGPSMMRTRHSGEEQ